MKASVLTIILESLVFFQSVSHTLKSAKKIPFNTTIESRGFALEKGKLLAEAVGCAGSNISTTNETEPISAESINCLRGFNWTVLFEAMYIPAITSLLLWNPMQPFQQIYGTELPIAPDILLERGEPRAKIHILSGNEQNEDPQSGDFVPSNKVQAYRFLRYYTKRMIVEKMTDGDFDRIFEYYFKLIKDDDKSNLKGAVSQFIGDIFLHCPLLLFVEKWAQQGQIVHEYINEYIMDGFSRKERSYGPYHGDDGFQNFGKAFYDYDEFSNRDRQVTREMIAFVADFVKGKRLKWPPMLARKEGHFLPLRWIINEKMDPRLIQVDPQDKICHVWGKVSGLKPS